ncbi:MAG: hypothetical protein HN353_04995 [Bdellovibrionales bacterium]|jgi:REP element-mobilizing transposase RayT|nr:hypothetical protein [Bdellovibrionales bacterium]MBT3527356.1 hypothetical protein [Bdellovibrionales bacterium]MBT7669891.1 hypothetical protein [Bdellovibrionales bacterium]MBT7767712.1 hypothetical protein [Bdellovibrionales bacterium]
MRKKQLALSLPTRGRPRKKGDVHKTKDGKIAHIERPKMDRNTPVHINIKVHKNIPNLRQKTFYRFFRQAVIKARIQGVRVIHFAIVKNHLHLLVEAQDNQSLSRGVRSLLISYAMRINRHLGRKGGIFTDRFNMEVIKFPKRMRYLLAYIFKNSAKHQKIAFTVDGYSSMPIFKEDKRLFGRKIATKWSRSVGTRLQKTLQEFLSPPKSWLAQSGWKQQTAI